MLRALARSLRPAQWTKNAFVLAPIVFAHRLEEGGRFLAATLAFVAFCAASSAVYLLNDLADRDEDRRHPVKRHRPIASGELPLPAAVVAAIVAGGGALLLGWRLGIAFLAILGGYLFINFAYTFRLKTVVILDVMVLAAGFVLRVLAGAVAIHVEVSGWLLLTTSFVALFLGFSKRRHELGLLADAAADQRQVLAHYSPVFLDQMINVTTASTVLAYALYTAAPETAEKLGTPYLVWTVPLVVYGIFRFLYLLYQRPGPRNPTEAILLDPPFLLNGVAWAALVLALIYG